jgi:hypothetical protein
METLNHRESCWHVGTKRLKFGKAMWLWRKEIASRAVHVQHIEQAKTRTWTRAELLAKPDAGV